MVFVQKAFKVDLTLFEVETEFQEQLYGWKGRLLMMNVIAYFQMHYAKNQENALKFVYESQKIATKVLQNIQRGGEVSAHRDTDYLIQTNLLAFLILWKARRFEQSEKYLNMAKQFIK